MIIDTHCHLNDERLIPHAERIVSEMQKDGLEALINVGYDFKSSKAAVEFAEKHNNVYAAIGIHPDASYTDCSEDNYEKMSILSQSKKVVAWGEIGLDYFRLDDPKTPPKAIQKGAFIEQIEVASMLGLPIAIHMRDAIEDTIEILNENIMYLSNGFVMHCYSGPKELVKQFADMGSYFSFGGAITFKNAKRNVEALKEVPLDRLLLETDCPYMAPTPHRGEMNEPKFISLVAQKAAEIKEIPVEKLIDITTNNAKALFTRIEK